jgi:dihydroxyacetone kinase
MLLPDETVVLRADYEACAPAGKVAIISGGGSAMSPPMPATWARAC